MSPQSRWIKFLYLLPGTTLSILVISIAFLRFYNERDFSFLSIITDTREWSNRITLAALVFALVNFGIEWNRQNRETDRLPREKQRRVEAAKQATRRTRIEIERDIAFLSFLTDSPDENRQKLQQVLLILKAYRDGI